MLNFGAVGRPLRRVPGTTGPGQSSSEKKAVWSRARGEGSSQSSTEDVMSGRVGGGGVGGGQE